MSVLAAWTAFRKGEIGSLTLRSFRLDDDPPTATVAAIAALPPPPAGGEKAGTEAAELRATGTEGEREAHSVVPNVLHRMGYGSHQIAPKAAKSPTQTAMPRSPEVLTEPGDIAPIGAKLHRFAPTKGTKIGKYPRQDSNL